jgi:chromosome segregation ATPase
MAALAGVNSSTASLQSSLIRSRLEVAKREADQAQSEVNQLRSQMDQAESNYQKRQDNVRSLSNQSGQSDPTYQSQIQTTETAVPDKTQSMLVGLYSATSAKRQADGNSLKADPWAAPVVNTRGQSTGRIVNISA